jgi:hypothetical protein
MEPTDITIVVLREIRDEIRSLKQSTEERFDRLERQQIETNERLDRHEKILERHEKVLIQLVHGLERHENALGLLIGEVRGLGSRIDNIVAGPLGEKVRDLDQRVTALESRVSG